MCDLPPIDPKIEASWKEALWDEFQKPYFRELKKFLVEEKASKQVVYPPGSKIFTAFNLTSLDEVKVVLLGQDPYHGPNQAHGLCFSVLEPTKPPPSLVNIYKEIHRDLGIPAPEHGNLSSWARQGVFMLNTALTVRKGQAGSHRKKGWEQFTDAVIRTVSERNKNLVFLLWGRDAQSKENLVGEGHLVLKTTHPSPFSARHGFEGCSHFSRTNAYLKEHGKAEINWEID